MDEGDTLMQSVTCRKMSKLDEDESKKDQSTYQSISDIVMDDIGSSSKPTLSTCAPPTSKPEDLTCRCSPDTESFKTVPEFQEPVIDIEEEEMDVGDNSHSLEPDEGEIEDFDDEVQENDEEKLSSTKALRRHNSATSSSSRKVGLPSGKKRPKVCNSTMSADKTSDANWYDRCLKYHNSSSRDSIIVSLGKNLEPPVRPVTAFKLFMNDFRKKYASKYPNISFSEMTDIGAEAWRDLPKSQKDHYLQMANKQQQQYFERLHQFQEKKINDKRNKPKNSYQLFMSDYLNKEYDKRINQKTQSVLTKQDLFARGVRKWKRMTKAQKAPYENQARISRLAHLTLLGEEANAE